MKVRRWVVRIMVSVVVAVAGVVLALRLFYPRLLYPAPQRDPHSPGSGSLLMLTSPSGVRVHATEFEGPGGAPVLVYFHGNGVVMGDVLWMAHEFSKRGLGVVLVEYRGYGLSAGVAPSEEGLYEDAETVLAALAARGVESRRILLFGESLGTGVAVEMAARGRGAWLALVTPYTSITDAASRFILGLPASVLMRERFESLSKAPQIRLPVLIVHGTDDSVVPYSMGTKLSTAFPHARLITVRGGHHNDLFLGDGARYFDDVVELVRR